MLPLLVRRATVVQSRLATPAVPVPFFGGTTAESWFTFRDTVPPLANTVGLVTHGVPSRIGGAFVNAQDDGTVEVLNGVVVPAGGTVTLATFVVLGPPAAYDATLAETIGLAGGPDFADLSVAEKVALANWGVPQRIATGPSSTGGPDVRLWDVDPATGSVSPFTGFFALDPAFTGGVSLAASGNALLVGAGPGAVPEIRVFARDADTGAIGPLVGFLSAVVYAPFFSGGVFVACPTLDLFCDDELVVGAGAGGEAHVRVLARSANGRSVRPLVEFLAFDPAFTGGVSIAVGDVDGDTVPDVVVGAGPGGGPHVKIFRVDAGAGTVTEPGGGFLAYDPGFTGGVQVAIANVDGTGPAEIVTGTGPGGGPHVRMWKVAPGGAVTELGSPGFLALPPGFVGGVSVAGGLFR